MIYTTYDIYVVYIICGLYDKPHINPPPPVAITQVVLKKTSLRLAGLQR